MAREYKVADGQTPAQVASGAFRQHDLQRQIIEIFA